MGFKGRIAKTEMHSSGISLSLRMCAVCRPWNTSTHTQTSLPSLYWKMVSILLSVGWNVAAYMDGLSNRSLLRASFVFCLGALKDADKSQGQPVLKMPERTCLLFWRRMKVSIKKTSSADLIETDLKSAVGCVCRPCCFLLLRWHVADVTWVRAGITFLLVSISG